MKEDVTGDMINFCGCQNCKDQDKCNGVDLINCYAEKKLTIKDSQSLNNLNKEE